MSLFTYLYDTKRGGGAAAFKCEVKSGTAGTAYLLNKPCGKITRTERGIWMHLKLVHRIVPQMELLECLENTDSINSGKEKNRPLPPSESGLQKHG